MEKSIFIPYSPDVPTPADKWHRSSDHIAKLWNFLRTTNRNIQDTTAIQVVQVAFLCTLHYCFPFSSKHFVQKTDLSLDILDGYG